ncbi:hypothetical protein H2200_011797 [Cladophialophora chaetospira]|uniref:Uncharacterized protein n=1 Tax=Cladophialophora chaetospira TaxID=386627 RepID=A0AA38WYQ4_9EURO|nr:hypothetical protein H2200_011797 [Cladophialophora chaetospira]
MPSDDGGALIIAVSLIAATYIWAFLTYYLYIYKPSAERAEGQRLFEAQRLLAEEDGIENSDEDDELPTGEYVFVDNDEDEASADGDTLVGSDEGGQASSTEEDTLAGSDEVHQLLWDFSG